MTATTHEQATQPPYTERLGTDDFRTPGSAPGTEQQVQEIAALLQSLHDAAADSGQLADIEPSRHENRLVQVRLGVASGLFTALRAKHAPTAAHSLRAALGCSAFALELGLDDGLCDAIEVAALLHDVGKIGVPDAILQKPARLTSEEQEIIAWQRLIGLEILGSCRASETIVDIIQYLPAWYDGSHGDYDRLGDKLPLGARVLTIVDAFDAMTTDHVYRPAWSRERAMAELFECAGSQFDPQLVKRFCDMHRRDPSCYREDVANRWLKTLDTPSTETAWQTDVSNRSTPTSESRDDLFERLFLGSMRDAVVFVDAQMQIFFWNSGAEQLTNIPASAVLQRSWSCELLRLRDPQRNPIVNSECPIQRCIQSGAPWQGRLILAKRDEGDVAVDLHVHPVVDPSRRTRGATILLHDVSPVRTLENLCRTLHEQATTDPLTGVGNRAKFDRVLERFITIHLDAKIPFSIIVSDIDHFKRVNDRHGHQAGDQAIQAVASVLTTHARPGDLVARYGGEEFVVLCAGCNNATATERAEQIRRSLAGQTISSLGGDRLTASFGVTELQPGDTPETLFRRADRALLQAKSLGRNLVVQLGSGMDTRERRRSWRWLVPTRPTLLLEKRLTTRVPLDMAVEKLRGFVADHNAKIAEVGPDHVRLSLEGNYRPWLERHGERSVPFVIDLVFSENRMEQLRGPKRTPTQVSETVINVTIRPKRFRDRRRSHATERARDVLASLKSYLMAEEYAPSAGVLSRATKALVPWRR
ncbi:MAG: diguanylate cyclase [Pirellulales bacterium]